MKRAITVLSILCTAVILSTAPTQAAVYPINLCLWDTVQLHPASDTINGFRLSLYGVNKDVGGVDIGAVTRVTGDFIGAQGAFVTLIGGDATGYQEAIVNFVEGNYLGVQFGALNITNGQFRGVQTGILSKAGNVRGVQFSCVNICDSLYGLQVGFFNINNTPNPFKFFPFVNWSF